MRLQRTSGAMMDHGVWTIAVTEEISLTLPATPDFLFLARLHVGAIASRLDMTIEEIEDLNLGVEELCLTVLGIVELVDGQLRIEVSWNDTSIRVECRRVGSAPARNEISTTDRSGLPSELSERILDALVDEHGTTDDRGEPVAWLIKSRKSAPHAS